MVIRPARGASRRAGGRYNGSFCKNINKRIAQAKKAYYALLSKIGKLCLPVDLSMELFDQLVLSVLTYTYIDIYGREVCGFQHWPDRCHTKKIH